MCDTCLELLECAEVWSNGCRIWGGGRNDKNYASAKINGVQWNVHRFIGLCKYNLLDIDDSEIEILHTCDTPPCIEPTHLKIGTTSMNMKDCYAKGRHRIVTIGEGGIASKLTNDKVREIRRLYKETSMTQAAIGVMFSIHTSEISRIVNRKIWAHVVD